MANGGATPAGNPGPLLARGRDADVFDLGDGTVLRRYRTTDQRTDNERRLMRFVAEAGVRVPRVFDLGPQFLADRDIVMERVDGITMDEDLERRPWKVLSYARLLARLQKQVAEVSAPEWMMSPGWVSRPSDDTRTDSVLHLDLHPKNVMMSSSGPVIIDWTNATGGPAGFDAAITYAVMSAVEVEDAASRIRMQVLVAAFRRARGSREVDAFLGAACDHLLADPRITPAERVNVAALRDTSKRRP